MNALYGLSRIKLLLTASSVLCGLSVGSHAFGQSTSGEAPEGEAPEAATKLDDIIVTARRRSENVREVPLTISVLNSEQLETRGVTDTLAIQHSTPGVTFGQSGGFNNFYSRGVGNSFVSPVAQAPIAFYLDGVYIANTSSAVFELSDIEQVEILKGPQGTLYGRNAVAGAITLTTRTPQPGLQARAQVSYGNYNTVKASAYIAGGSDKVQASLSAGLHKGDAYIKNLVPGLRDLNAVDTVSVRGKVRFVPNSDIEIIAAADYLRDKGYGFSGGGAFGYPETGGTVVATDVLLGGVVTDRPWRTTFAGDFSNDGESWGASLTGRFDLGSARLVSISGYRHNDLQHSIPSGAGSSGRNIIRTTDFSRTFTQELQLLSDNDSPLSYLVGLYYLHDDGGYNPLSIKQNVLFPIGIDINSKVKTNSYSAFGEVNYKLTDDLTLIGGLRYTKDNLAHYEANRTTRTPFPPFTTVVNSPGATASFSAFTPRVSIKYKRPEGLYYATFSQGYRAGLFNASNIAPTAAIDLPVRPEKLTAYEVGAKWEFPAQALRVNLAGFYYDDKNLQVASVNPSGAINFQNASARIYGVDFDAEWRPFDALTLRVAASYLDSRYTSYQDASVYVAHSTPISGTQQGVAPCPGDTLGTTVLNASCLVAIDLTGHPLLRAPKFTGLIGADLRLPIPESAGQATLTGNLYHSDAFRTTANGTMVSPGYELLNVTLRYVLPDERTSVSLFGTNLTNAKYYVTGGEQELARGVMYGPPRMYGITLAYKLD